ncbi:hypothetical protein PG985_003893 [Apiospora marii]|uniref:uncharacterized protein n=1 Tax=Apiospora marii TaxID=335849 RepID=UPI00313227BC
MGPSADSSTGAGLASTSLSAGLVASVSTDFSSEPSTTAFAWSSGSDPAGPDPVGSVPTGSVAAGSAATGSSLVGSGSADSAVAGSAAVGSGSADSAEVGSVLASSTFAGSAGADSVLDGSSAAGFSTAGSSAVASSFSAWVRGDSSCCSTGDDGGSETSAAAAAGASETSGEVSLAASVASGLTSSPVEATSAAAGFSTAASSGAAASMDFSLTSSAGASWAGAEEDSIAMLRALRDSVKHLGLVLGIEPLVHVLKSSGSGVICHRGRLAVLVGGDSATFIEYLLDESLRLLVHLLLFARLGVGDGLVLGRLSGLHFRRSCFGGGGRDLAVIATHGAQLVTLRGGILLAVASAVVLRRTGTLGDFLVGVGRDLEVFGWLLRCVLGINFLGGNFWCCFLSRRLPFREFLRLIIVCFRSIRLRHAQCLNIAAAGLGGFRRILSLSGFRRISSGRSGFLLVINGLCRNFLRRGCLWGRGIMGSGIGLGFRGRGAFLSFGSLDILDIMLVFMGSRLARIFSLGGVVHLGLGLILDFLRLGGLIVMGSSFGDGGFILCCGGIGCLGLFLFGKLTQSLDNLLIRDHLLRITQQLQLVQVSPTRASPQALRLPAFPLADWVLRAIRAMQVPPPQSSRRQLVQTWFGVHRLGYHQQKPPPALSVLSWVSHLPGQVLRAVWVRASSPLRRGLASQSALQQIQWQRELLRVWKPLPELLTPWALQVKRDTYSSLLFKLADPLLAVLDIPPRLVLDGVHLELGLVLGGVHVAVELPLPLLVLPGPARLELFIFLAPAPVALLVLDPPRLDDAVALRLALPVQLGPLPLVRRPQVCEQRVPLLLQLVEAGVVLLY